MAEIKLSIEPDQIQRLLGSDRGLAELMEGILNQVLEGGKSPSTWGRSRTNARPSGEAGATVTTCAG